jgi:hypothetical protein
MIQRQDDEIIPGNTQLPQEMWSCISYQWPDWVANMGTACRPSSPSRKHVLLVWHRLEYAGHTLAGNPSDHTTG